MQIKLEDFQSRFLAAITARGDDLLDLLRPDTRDAIPIYQNSFFIRGLDALRSAFPGCRQLCGSELFDRIAVQFMSKVPSTSGSIGALYRAFEVNVAGVGQSFGRADLGALAALELAIEAVAPNELRWLELEFDASLLLKQLSQGIVGAVSPQGSYFIAVGVDSSGSRHAVASPDVARTLRAGGSSDQTDEWLARHPWATV